MYSYSFEVNYRLYRTRQYIIVSTKSFHFLIFSANYRTFCVN